VTAPGDPVGPAPRVVPAGTTTRLLVLGGSAYVGRAVVADARARGWDVTTYNRGTSEPPAGVRALHGDRTRPDGLAALGTEEWDVVVDTWAGAPAIVRAAARRLSGRVGAFAYISSRSVYAFPTPAGADETAEVVDADPGDTDSDDYARAKRGGELAVLESHPDGALLVRAGLVLGPWSNIGRLPWWLARIGRGGDVLAPGPPDLALQFVDVRDLAAFTLTATTAGRRGAHDVVSPSGHATMRTLLAACVAATGSTASLHWTAPDELLAADVQPWTELPIWIPPGELHDALHRSDPHKAQAAGLVCRPVAETVAGTWAWMQGLDGPPARRDDLPPIGLDADREHALLTGRGH
jgi:2'-hydroxyisoflavone reductase